MTESEKRIRILEDKAAAPDSDTVFIRTLALCEIARQLSRLGDIYEFELGINDDYRPNLPVRRKRRHTGTRPELPPELAALVDPKLGITADLFRSPTCDDPNCWCHDPADPTTLAEIFRKEKKP